MQANRFATAILAVSAAAFAGGALAETPNAVPEAQFTSTKSRAAVQAELAQYKQAGVNYWSQFYNPLRNFQSTTTREQVTAGYIASRDEVAARNAESVGFAAATPAVAPAASTTLAGQADQGNLR